MYNKKDKSRRHQLVVNINYYILGFFLGNIIIYIFFLCANLDVTLSKIIFIFLLRPYKKVGKTKIMLSILMRKLLFLMSHLWIVLHTVISENRDRYINPWNILSCAFVIKNIVIFKISLKKNKCKKFKFLRRLKYEED